MDPTKRMKKCSVRLNRVREDGRNAAHQSTPRIRNCIVRLQRFSVPAPVNGMNGASTNGHGNGWQHCRIRLHRASLCMNGASGGVHNGNLTPASSILSLTTNENERNDTDSDNFDDEL